MIDLSGLIQKVNHKLIITSPYLLPQLTFKPSSQQHIFHKYQSQEYLYNFSHSRQNHNLRC